LRFPFSEVCPARLAQLRAPPEAFGWRSKVWRLGRCADATQSPGSSRTTARARRKTGAALDGWTGPDERRRRCPPESGRSESSSVRTPEERPERRNATGGAPEGARAGHTARGHRRKVPRLPAPFGAPPPRGGQMTRARLGARADRAEHPRTGVPRSRESSPSTSKNGETQCTSRETHDRSCP
jgi:hypothetical protein